MKYTAPKISRSHKSRIFNSRITFVTLAVFALLTLATTSVLALTGAIFTTRANGTTVNGNIYATKADVYLNGGPPPNAPCSAAGLPDGTYYYQVTDPSGKTLLSTDAITDRQVTVSGGVFISADDHTTLTGTCGGITVQLTPFADTPNNGGEYKVWITLQSDYLSPADPNFNSGGNSFGFQPSKSKTDNFKVKERGGLPPPNPLAAIVGLKFYDTNANGTRDSGEPVIPGWRIEKTPPTPADVTYTSTLGQYSYLIDTLGVYTISEVAPPPGFVPAPGAVWVNTTPTSGNVTVTQANINNQDTVAGPDFGNVCLGPGGGRTLGFWSNKNGQAVINDGGSSAPELTLLNNLCLSNATGPQPDFANYTAFRTWLLSANAVNMAYMLSAQLAAMELNVEAGFVSGSAVVYAPGTPGANAFGFITINALMTAANNALCADGYTPSGDPNRSVQEALKNALDSANNNVNFVQPTPCAFTTPY